MTQIDLRATDTDVSLVRAQFTAACLHLGTHDKPEKRIERGLRDIAIAYGAPGRHYHNLAHIAWMLRGVEKLKLSPFEHHELVAATVWHDYVYETRNRETYRQNEARSATAADAFFQAIRVPSDVRERMTSRIRATQTHKIADDDRHGQAFLDLDMAILARERPVYAAYSQAIRREFASVPTMDFYTARLNAFIDPTLQSERIFLTDRMHKLDFAARENLRWEKALIERALRL